MSADTGKIFTQIPLVMADIGAISKSRNNPQQGYKFRGIDEVYNAVNSALSKHGVFCAPTVLSMSREERQTKNGGTLLYTILNIKYTFYASDGSSFDCVTVGEAMDSGDKSCNKAMSAAQKYAFFQVFSIPTEEQKDTEQETHEVTPKDTTKPEVLDSAALEKKIRECTTLPGLKIIWDKNQTAIKSFTDPERKQLEVTKDMMKEYISTCKQEGAKCKRAMQGVGSDEIGCELTMRDCPYVKAV